MFRTLFSTVALIAVFAAPAAVFAHDGHAHKVMGTVSTVSPKQLEVKTADGQITVVTLNPKTVYRQGKARAEAKMLKVGDRVVVEGTQATGAKTVTATVVQMAEAPAPAKK